MGNEFFNHWRKLRQVPGNFDQKNLVVAPSIQGARLVEWNKEQQAPENSRCLFNRSAEI